MAQNKEANKAVYQIIANLKSKFAELDALDEEFAEFDDVTPEGEGVDEFNLLSEKREELEDDIRAMRERVQLISEWEKFKGTGWSDDVQMELNALDQQFTAIADGSDEPFDVGTPVPPEPIMSPEAPVLDGSEPPPAVDTPDVPTVKTPEGDSLPAEPLPTSNKNSKMNTKKNYGNTDKKQSSVGSSNKKGDTHMANQSTKPASLKEKLAEIKLRREAIQKEAKARVASAWTIAKTMLPTAPTSVQKAFAASLLNNPTKVLTAALKQTAINAHYAKIAETVHKDELNGLQEDPSVLAKERKAIETELKGDAKSAASKKADDRKDAGEQPEKYDDGRDGSEPKELDASKAGERPDAGKNPGQTQNLSEGKSAATKKACVGKDCAGCKNENCKGKKSSKKTADVDGEALPEEDSDAPVEETPSELPEPIQSPEDDADDIISDEKKEILTEKIDEAQAAIKAIESEILDENEEEIDFANIEGGEEEHEGEELEGFEEEFEEETPEGDELNFADIFKEENLEDKAASLANEGEEKFAGEEDDFFHPSKANALEDDLDDDGMGDMHSMFSSQDSDGDPLASLLAGMRTAAEVAGISVIPSNTGEAANHFDSDEATGEDRDYENDHESDLWADAIEDIKPEEQGSKRIKQDSTNKLEKPKAAATLKKIRTASGSDRSVRPVNAVDALFNDGF